MAKNNKGKKKVEQSKPPAPNEARDAIGFDLPPPAHQSSPDPKPIRLVPRINTTNLQIPQVVQQRSPPHDNAPGAQVGDDWARQGQGASYLL